MKSVASHGNLSLLFVMKMMVGHFVTNTHKVMTVLILVLLVLILLELTQQLLLQCCCGVFFAIS